MDRAAEIPLQSSALWPAGHHCKRNSQGKTFSCLLAFCLLAVFMLALPVCYLLGSHFREPQACKAEERAGRKPEFLEQSAMPTPELKPRAHLTELATQTSKCERGSFPILQWTYDHGDLNSNMKYINGCLVIPKSGDYFVYAHVTFRNPSNDSDNCGTNIREITHVTQTISKHTNAYPVPIELLRSSSSRDKKQNWNHGIYLGAIARLQANDRLFVNVSNTRMVHIKGKQNFFGAFLI